MQILISYAKQQSDDPACTSRLNSDSAAGQQRDWQVLVRHFRSLRASLLVHDNAGPFAVRVSLWATDVTLQAQDYAECLKSLQGLYQQLDQAIGHHSSACDVTVLTQGNHGLHDNKVLTPHWLNGAWIIYFQLQACTTVAAIPA